jgi:2-alkenal reductase
MQRRFSILFMMVALVALLLTGCSTITETVGQAVSDQVASVLPTLAASASLPTNEAVIQPASQTDPTVEAPFTDAEDAAAEPEVVQPVPVQQTTQERVFIDLYQRVNPAVVSVNLTSGGGSGFVIDPDGYIVTNNHVIAEGGPIVVGFADGSTYDAELVGADSQADLALLKIDATGLTALPLGDSDALEVGQLVVAIGSPFGLDNTMTTGIVSGLSRSLPADSTSTLGSYYTIPSVIQTDAAINPGNSGGPLINLAGEVIGINTAIESPVAANSGVGFAVPSTVVKTVITQLRAGGEVTYPWLGISGGTLTSAMAQEMGLDSATRGVLVSDVTAGGPAEAAGLLGGDLETGLGGDVITAIDGQTVIQFDDLLSYIVINGTVGQTITLNIVRDGQPQTISVTLGERPDTIEQPQLQQDGFELPPGFEFPTPTP